MNKNCLTRLKSPRIHSTAFVHPKSEVFGDVSIGKDCWIGPFASIRGDFGRVIIGEKCNIQEGCVLHSFPGEEVVLEECVHVGHGAILHGCNIHSNVLIGIRATVLDKSVIHANNIIGAHSLVLNESILESGHLYFGSPVKQIRILAEDEIRWIQRGILEYVSLIPMYKNLPNAERRTFLHTFKPKIK